MTREPGVTTTASRAVQLIRFEWIKEQSLRSTPLVLALTAAAILIGGIDTARTATQSQALFDPVYNSADGLIYASLPAGILGILAVTSELATGSIRSTIAAVPRRGHLLASKAAIVAGLLFAATEVTSITNLVLVHLLAAKRSIPIPLTTLTDVRAVIGTGVYLSIMGLIGLALGTLIRNTAGAAGVMSALVFVALVAPNATYLPQEAGTQICRTIPDHAALSPWVGLAILAACAIAIVAAGTHAFCERDL
jgi:ABC-2 type transport system permease protein